MTSSQLRHNSQYGSCMLYRPHAGTDAKIARIHKRGVEVLDLAMLDPVFPHHALSIPPLSAREESRKSADLARHMNANSASNANASGSSLVSDLKPANLLSKFKRFSFRGTPAAAAATPHASLSGSSTNSAESDIRTSTIKESRRSSWLGGSAFSSSTSSATLAPSNSSVATQVAILPVVPLFREKGPNEPGLKGLPDGLNVKITKHSPGYTWLVRHYLRKDLAEAKQVAEISIEWRKKQRRQVGGRAHQSSSGNGVVIKDLSKARAESRGSNRRGSVQMDPSVSPDAAHGGVLHQQPDRHSTPNRTHGRVPTTHIQTPSDEAIPAMMPRTSIDQPETPTRISKSVDLPRASSVPMEGNSRSANAVSSSARNSEESAILKDSRRASIDAGRASPLGAGRRAADMLSPNLLGRYRTAPNASQHKHSTSSSSQTTANDSTSTTRQERSSSPATYILQTAGKGESGSDSGHGDTSADLDDEDEDSDPEDSERPWICELVIKRYSQDQHHSLQSAQRVLLGTLTPAPHHPKLVAHLAIPLTLVPTNIGPIHDVHNSSLTSLNSDSDMHSLSIEEMKDLMTVTALWLVVRENLGLGGIHKARKNDGAWRFATPAALKGGRG